MHQNGCGCGPSWTRFCESLQSKLQLFLPENINIISFPFFFKTLSLISVKHRSYDIGITISCPVYWACGSRCSRCSCCRWCFGGSSSLSSWFSFQSRHKVRNRMIGIFSIEICGCHIAIHNSCMGKNCCFCCSWCLKITVFFWWTKRYSIPCFNEYLIIFAEIPYDLCFNCDYTGMYSCQIDHIKTDRLKVYSNLCWIDGTKFLTSFSSGFGVSDGWAGTSLVSNHFN